ncbi:MAG: hypothetical protein COA79_14830 [Planctomycetota bacterium]|nr:MAG: hypothetical protein COA79_14830 [Planctomycetota bacterium]
MNSENEENQFLFDPKIIDTDKGQRIRGQCPSCEKTFRVNTNVAGKNVNCPGCKISISIPSMEMIDSASNHSEAENEPHKTEKVTSQPEEAESTTTASPSTGYQEALDAGKYVAKGVFPFPDFISPGFRKIESLVDNTIKPKKEGSKLFLLGSLALGLCVAGTIFAMDPTAFQSSGSVKEKTEYQKKIEAAKVAGQIAKELEGKITMPTEPPDPESVIEEAMEEEIDNNISKMFDGEDGQMSSLEIKGIASKVKQSMEAELKNFAALASQGKLTPEQLAEKQKELADKAHLNMNKELKSFRVKTQTKRASFKSIEWYQNSVSPSLIKNISINIFRGGDRIKPSWNNLFNGRYTGWSNALPWSTLSSEKNLKDTTKKLGRISRQKWDKPAMDAFLKDYNKRRNQQIKLALKRKRNKPKILPLYEPNLQAWQYSQAINENKSLQIIYKGSIKKGGVYPTPSWQEIAYGIVNEHIINGRTIYSHMGDGIVNEFVPEHQEYYYDIIESLDSDWETILDLSASISEMAANQEPINDLIKVQGTRNQAIIKLNKGINKLYSTKGGKKIDFNKRLKVYQLLRFKYLTDQENLKEKHDYFIDTLVVGLTDVIKDFARSQFEKGMIDKNQAGIDEKVNQFVIKMIPILNSDFKEQIVNLKYFSYIVIAGASHKKFRDILGDYSYFPETKEDIQGELNILKSLLSKNPHLAKYAEEKNKRLDIIMKETLNRVVDEILLNVLMGDWLTRDLNKFVEGVDYSDPVAEKIQANERAKQGRKQDLTKMTKDGVPDTNASMVSLNMGLKQGQGVLQPVIADMTPTWRIGSFPQISIKHSKYYGPPKANKGGFAETQTSVKELNFNYPTPIVEGIPFLSKLPNFDGNLSEWENIRPLYLKHGSSKESIQVYAGWNYQGYYFAYTVKTKQEDIILPKNTKVGYKGKGFKKSNDMRWAYSGETFRICFDTLDARNADRGEPHNQEIFVMPLGTTTNSKFTGVERVIASKRAGKSKQFRGVTATQKEYFQQGKYPSSDAPYRVTKMNAEGYTTEIFIPRTLFNRKVFSPGWKIGFNCMVATGPGRRSAGGNHWVKTDYTSVADHPDAWGDLVLLGTDPRIIVQLVDKNWTVAKHILPGHSILMTVIDPDRNVYSTVADQIVVSAEVKGGNNDAEVFILQETGTNTGVFRGIINTQPGFGKEVQGVMEVMAGNKLILKYVDFGNSKGQKNKITKIILPVVGGLLQ